MKLRSVVLENFRAVDRLELPLDPTLTVLVGENGAGKTTVLEGIVLGLHSILARYPGVKSRDFKANDLKQTYLSTSHLLGEPEAIFLAKRPYVRVLLEAHNDLRWDRIHRRDKTPQTAAMVPKPEGVKKLWEYIDPMIHAGQEGQAVTLPVFVYYGIDRAIPDIPQRQRNFRREFDRFLALDGALDAGFRFKEVMEWFIAQEDLERRERENQKRWDYRRPQLETARQAITRILPNCKNPRSQLHPLRLIVDFEATPGHYEELSINEMSGGYRTMFALVMDLVRRVAQANPHREDPARETEGIVLIDEVELHLHPRWQQQILVNLNRAFPKLQFIVTTHSPQVLTTVYPGNIVILRRAESGIIAEPAHSSYGAESHRVLSEILGVDPRPPVEYNAFTKLLADYRQLIERDAGETDEALNLRKKLAELSPDDPALTRADLEIRRRRALKQRESSK
jgi:predicted ATP-binding protein involved in virulence